MPECGRKNELESGGRRAGLFAKRNPAMQANCVLGKTNWPNAGLAAEPPSLSYETKPLRSGGVNNTGMRSKKRPRIRRMPGGAFCETKPTDTGELRSRKNELGECGLGS